METQAEKYLSRDEAEARLVQLTDADYLRLCDLARLYAVASPEYDWEDLLGDAFLAVLSGNRQWPEKLSTPVFFKNVLRSLCSSRAKSRKRAQDHIDLQSEADVMISDEGHNRQPVSNAPGNPESPEEFAYADETLKQFHAAFSDDPEGWDVFEWLAEGFLRKEIQEEFGFSDTEYDTITKRIRRKIARVSKAMES